MFNSRQWVICAAIAAASIWNQGTARADDVAPTAGTSVPTAVTTPNPPAPSGAPDATKPPVHVNLTEADFYAAAFGGLAFSQSSLLAGGFMVEAAYRFLSKLPRLSTGLSFGYFGAANKGSLMTINVQSQWAFSDENRGLVAGIDLGVGLGTNSPPKTAFSVAPRVEYYIPVFGDWTIGAQVSAQIEIASPVYLDVSTFLGIRYWL